MWSVSLAPSFSFQDLPISIFCTSVSLDPCSIFAKNLGFYIFLTLYRSGLCPLPSILCFIQLFSHVEAVLLVSESRETVGVLVFGRVGWVTKQRNFFLFINKKLLICLKYFVYLFFFWVRFYFPSSPFLSYVFLFIIVHCKSSKIHLHKIVNMLFFFKFVVRKKMWYYSKAGPYAS